MPTSILPLIAPSSSVLFADGAALILRDKKGREKTIPIFSIQTVNIEPPTRFKRGSLYLSIPKSPTGAFGIGGAAVMVGNESERYVFTSEHFDEANQIVAYIRSAISHRGESAPSQSTGSLADELAKLKALLDSGTLTQEEFETAKKKLLD